MFKQTFLKTCLLAFGLLCSSGLWAKQYCQETLTSNTGWNGDYGFSAEKLSDTQTKFTVSALGDELITGIYQLQVRGLGGGTIAGGKVNWDPGDAAFSGSDFALADNGKSYTITINWVSYPTSDIRIYLIMRRNNSRGGSDIFGQEISDIDVSASCSAGPADTEAPVMNSASLISKTMTSAIIAVDATDNVGVAKYRVVETANGVNVQLTPADGNIVVEELTQGTSYSFVITALDAAGNESANSKTVDVTTDAPIAPYASNKGFGTFQGRVDLYDWVGDYAGENACGQVDLYVVTWGDDILFKAKGVEKNFEDGTDWKCQLRTRNNDLSDGIRESWGKTVVNSSTRISEFGNTYNNHKGLMGYGDQFKMWSYMVMAGCGARTMQTMTYTRDYINNPTSDDVAPVLTSASAAADGGNMVVTLSEVTSEEVFYMIVDEDHNKKFISMTPRFVLPKDGSGVTYRYSCYAIDFNGNMSAAQLVDVSMAFNPTTNLAKNKNVFKSGQANNNNMIAANGNDGKTDTRWSSGAVDVPTEAWWAVDLGADYLLSEIKIMWEGAFADKFIISGTSTLPTDFADDSQWVNTIYEKTEGGITAGQFTSYEAAGHARYVRIKANHLANEGWGMSFWEFEVYATGIYDPNAAADEEAPVLTSVVYNSKTHNSITLAVEATDNVGVVSYKVRDAAHDFEETVVAENGVIVVTGLTRETSYTLSVTAIDAVGNVSNAIVLEPIVTMQDPNIPYVAAPVPDLSGKIARAIYSDALPNILAHGFNKRTWVTTTYEDRNINGDNHILYDMREKTETCWGVDGDGAEGIIAIEGYNNGVDKGIDASMMEYLHIDIWSNVPQPNAYVNLCDGKLANTPHNGNGWQSFDLPLDVYTYSSDKGNISNIRWMKFPGYNASSYVAIDNVYFWKEVRVESLSLRATDGTDYYATFSSATAVEFEDAEVYTVTIANGEMTLNEVASKQVPANAGVLVKHNSTSANYTLIASAADLGENNLRAASVAKEAEGYKFYKLAYGDSELTPSTLGFYWGAEDGASFSSREGSAYLAVPVDQQAAPQRFVFNSANTATGMDELQTVEDAKLMENGQLIIIRNGVRYNVLGQIIK